MGKIITIKELESLGDFRKPFPKRVLCHGVFDVLHAGHLNYLEEAKKHGDVLIVSVTSDRYINKGPGRPYFDQNTRARMLASLSVIDHVVISDFPTSVEVIGLLKPHVYVKGPDYKDHSKDVTGEIANEIHAVESYGGKVRYTDTPTFSSSALVNRFSGQWTEDQKATIERINELGGYELIEKRIERLGNLKVLVAGESIIDTYRFVEPQNISSKSPSISAKFIREENYAGGALAIRNHLQSFVNNVDILTQLDPTRTCRKIRYIDANKSQRMFEVTHISDDCWENEYTDPVIDFDTLLIADFGHGMFDGERITRHEQFPGFVALNVQTNSSNYGFNPFTKHKRFDYLCIDKREAQVAFHDNKSTTNELVSRVAETVGRDFSVTLGSAGAQYNNYRCPAFAGEIVDAIGAGDAYFAITALLVRTECEPEMVPFIGNVFAGLKTKIIGNKSSVTKAQLLKACQSILK